LDAEGPASALLALAVLGPGCKREEEAGSTRAVAPYVEWCEAQGAARNGCLVSAARVTGDAAACAKLKSGAPERTACLLAAAKTSGRVDVCRPLSDRDLVLCALGVAAEHGRSSACDVLENVHWQGGATRALCAAVARGEAEACTPPGTGELGELCLRFLALRRRDASVCTRLGKDAEDVQRCTAAVAVASGAPEACAAAFSGAPGGSGQRRCELEAGMAKLLAARVAWANADNAVQIHGGNGFALEFPVSRILCDARILNIFEGAAEIQAQVIARRLLDGTN